MLFEFNMERKITVRQHRCCKMFYSHQWTVVIHSVFGSPSDLLHRYLSLSLRVWKGCSSDAFTFNTRWIRDPCDVPKFTDQTVWTS